MEAKNIYSRNAGLEGWHNNTELCVNLKTVLSGDRRMKAGKAYRGVLRLDSDAVIEEFLSRDAHCTFTETLSPTGGRRSPRVYDGKYITVTVRDDGSFHPNFKNMRVGADFTVDGYALGVCDELRRALTGLVGR